MKHYNVEVFSDEHLIVKIDGLVIKNVCLSNNYNRIHKSATLLAISIKLCFKIQMMDVSLQKLLQFHIFKIANGKNCQVFAYMWFKSIPI